MKLLTLLGMRVGKKSVKDPEKLLNRNYVVSSEMHASYESNDSGEVGTAEILAPEVLY